MKHDPRIVSLGQTFIILSNHHYLGPTKSGALAWRDEHGVMVFSTPRSRRLPGEWLELTRWCLTGEANAGSRQWASFVGYARANIKTTTIVSYSDPSRGHTGALYRACGWLWAPTWLRLRPPPSANGAWTAENRQAVKDRWIYPLTQDERRQQALSVQDDAVMLAMPWAQYSEPAWRRGKPTGGGGDFKRFVQQAGPK